MQVQSIKKPKKVNKHKKFIIAEPPLPSNGVSSDHGNGTTTTKAAVRPHQNNKVGVIDVNND